VLGHHLAFQLGPAGVRQFERLDPQGEVALLHVHRLAGLGRAHGVGAAGELGADIGDRKAGLLGQFAARALRESFARLQGAAGEGPEGDAGERAGLEGEAEQQDAAFSVDQQDAGGVAAAPDARLAQRGARLARIRCKVRRCMFSRRAVSETLWLHSS